MLQNWILILKMEYKEFAETTLGKPNLVIHPDGTLNKQEAALILGDKDNYGIVAFSKNPFYDKHYFISCYSIKFY